MSEDDLMTMGQCKIWCFERHQELISEFVDDLKNKDYFWRVYRNNLIVKWVEKLK